MGGDDQSMSNASHFNDNFNNLDGYSRRMSMHNQDGFHGRNKSFMPPNMNKQNNSVLPGSRNNHLRKNTMTERNRIDKTGG